jgi:hypothetical protein
MSPEEPQVVPEDGISRRRMLKRIGAGAAVAWTAPILTSVRTPAFAAYPSRCDPGAECNTQMPCNFAIPCKNGNFACNCWVIENKSGCHCGDLDLCVNHQPCASQADCPSGQTCIENCCGKLCYAPCSALANARGPRAGSEYGIL